MALGEEIHGMAGTNSRSDAARPSYQADGTVRVPGFDLPPSNLMSKVGAASLSSRSQHPVSAAPQETDIVKVRERLEQQLAPMVASMQHYYPVDVSEKWIDGVRTRVVRPHGVASDPDRMIINLHGGSFSKGAGACALLESIPIAGLAKIPVVMVDYRMAPEASHPAALEDAEKIYRHLLAHFSASQIGIFGGSAGGVLASQMAARLPARNLPQMGALGIFGAGAVPFGFGDSGHVAAYIEGSYPAPLDRDLPLIPLDWGYFKGVDMRSPEVSPGLHLDALAAFPPSLIITGSRAFDMSPAIFTHSQLLKVGVRSQLIVGEALGHCYIYNALLPEALDAHRVIAAFFKENLGPSKTAPISMRRG